jgi:hypothetical protein
MNTWYLGIHQPNWLASPTLAEVPVFISRRTFYDRRAGRYRRTFPRAGGRYAIDSGGFTELKDHGRWIITPAEYVDFLDRVWEETGAYDFAAPMDWMCEPAVIAGGRFAGLHFVGTGLSEAEHQRLTLDNFLDLRTRAPRRRVAPVLQAWRRRGYLRHRAMYAAAGIDLSAEPVVGLGSVCRRQNTDEVADIINALLDSGVRNLHGFGFKVEGLRRCWPDLTTERRSPCRSVPAPPVCPRCPADLGGELPAVRPRMAPQARPATNAPLRAAARPVRRLGGRRMTSRPSIRSTAT